MFIYEGHPSRLQSRQKELSTALWLAERFNHTVDTHAWKPLGQLREPVLPFSAAEQQAVQDLLNQDVHNEVSLTNQVFFVRHPHRRGTKIGAGEAALASEWRTIRDLLVRPKLVVLPPTIPRRPCCIFAPVTPFGSNIVDPANLGHHKEADEANGIVYTGRAGFMDLGHLRETCDLTEFVWMRLQGFAGLPTVIPTIQGEATIVRQVPPNRWLTVAQAIAFDDALGHEIMTYDLQGPGMHNSAFSPEDLCSNFVGTVVARMAIGIRGVFRATVTARLARVLKDLRAQTPTETRKAFDKVNGRWVAFTNALSIRSEEYLKRRNFTRRPFKVRHPSDATTPSWVLGGFGDAETFYSYKHTLVKTIPKTSFAAEILRIRADARARYGNDFDKP